MAGAVQAIGKANPSLHVEVRVKGGSFVNTAKVRENVLTWLPQNFVSLRVGEEIEVNDTIPDAAVIESIRVVDCTGHAVNSSFHRIDEVHLDVQTYELQEDRQISSSPLLLSEDGDENTGQFIRSFPLPSQSLAGMWESLHFNDNLGSQLLHYAARIMAIARNPDLDCTLMNFNRMILLHGPPGTGKTSLCRALSHKLAIRLSEHYTQGCLIEVNSSSLHSKWFGESGKKISKLFEKIHTIANEPSTLVCVLIDEVETIAGSRDRASKSNDVGDALRATNELLGALDKLRHRSNVLLFCTSNLLTAVDSAFLDRADIKQFVGNPTPNAAYEILRSCLNELVRCQTIKDPNDNVKYSKEDRDAVNPFPSVLRVNVHYWNKPNSKGYKLWHIAEQCKDISGRTLRRLPFLAIAKHIYRDPCTANEALKALALAVEEEPKGHALVRN